MTSEFLGDLNILYFGDKDYSESLAQEFLRLGVILEIFQTPEDAGLAKRIQADPVHVAIFYAATEGDILETHRRYSWAEPLSKLRERNPQLLAVVTNYDDPNPHFAANGIKHVRMSPHQADDKPTCRNIVLHIIESGILTDQKVEAARAYVANGRQTSSTTKIVIGG